MIFPPDAHVAKAVALPATPVDAALLRAMRYVMPAHRFRAARLVSAAGAEFPFDVLIPFRVIVEALAPATERPSAGLNALALATQMEL